MVARIRSLAGESQPAATHIRGGLAIHRVLLVVTGGHIAQGAARVAIDVRELTRSRQFAGEAVAVGAERVVDRVCASGPHQRAIGSGLAAANSKPSEPKPCPVNGVRTTLSRMAWPEGSEAASAPRSISMCRTWAAGMRPRMSLRVWSLALGRRPSTSTLPRAPARPRRFSPSTRVKPGVWRTMSSAVRGAKLAYQSEAYCSRSAPGERSLRNPGAGWQARAAQRSRMWSFMGGELRRLGHLRQWIRPHTWLTRVSHAANAFRTTRPLRGIHRRPG